MKVLLRIFLTLFLLVIVVAGAVLYYLSSGQVRGMLEQTVAQATGLELAVAGEVDLKFLPDFRLTLNDVRLRNPGRPQELLSSATMELRVDAAELFAGRLLVQELLAHDLHVNYFIDAQGNALWAKGDRQEDAAPVTGAEAPESDDSPTEVTIERITLDNASIHYQDLANGVRYQVDSLNLSSLDANLSGRPFALSIDFDFDDSGLSRPLPVALDAQVQFDREAGNLSLQNLNASVTPMLLQGSLTIANLNQAPQFSGALRAEPFDLLGLMETLALREMPATLPGQNDGERPRLSFATEFSGNHSEASVPSLTLTLDETGISGSARLRFPTEFEPLNVSYELIAGNLNLTPFLSTPADDPESGDRSSNPALAAALPTASLRAVNLLGSVSLAALNVGAIRLDNVDLFTYIEDGVLDIEVAPASVFQGSLAGSLRLDARSDTADLQSRWRLNQANLVELAPLAGGFDSFAGNLTVAASHRASGRSISELLDSAQGATAFNVSNSSIDITLLKQVFTAIAALSPRGESIQQWPDVVRFTNLGGLVTLEQGLSSGQELHLRMDNFALTGGGGVDLVHSRFDYDVNATVLGEPYTQTIPIDPRYHGIAWPVQCAAGFSDAINQYCRPDFDRVRQIFARLGTDTPGEGISRSLDEVINESVPEDLQDIARDLLDSLLDP